MQCQKLKTYMESGRVVFLPVSAIHPNPAQPRKLFQEDALTQLADSIRRHGILQPLSVRRVGSAYELIAGERRLRAGQLAGLTELPCIIMRMDDEESSMTALVENIQRQDLHYIEQAQGICRLMDRFSMSQEQAARALGKSQSGIANKLRLLRHSTPVLNALRELELTERHARALLKVASEEEKLRIISLASQQQWSVARLEGYIDQLDIPSQTPKQTNIRQFLLHVSQTLTKIQQDGIAAVSERKETEDRIILTITIPKLI